MFAIVKTGGKQHRVSNGDILRVEKLSADVGTQTLLNEVVMLGKDSDIKIGNPCVAGAGVAVEVLQHARAGKIIVFKRKRRQNYRRTKGHRQHYSLVKVIDILADASKFKATTVSEPTKQASTKTVAKKSVAKKASVKKATAKKATAKKSSSS